MREYRPALKFYRSSNGREPVKDWLKKCPPEHARKIFNAIKKAELGWGVKKSSYIRQIDDDIYEIKIEVQSHWVRVLFTHRESCLLLLHIFLKQSNTTPADDIKTARNRLNKV